MIDQWLNEEIESKIQKRNLVVVIDPHQQLDNLVSKWSEKWQVKSLDTQLQKKSEQIKEELYLRIELEKNRKVKTLVYSQRPLEQLSFTFDYTQTHGLIDFSNPETWLRKKLFNTTGMQINLSKDDLLTAAKASEGKDLKWWRGVLQGITDVVDVDKEILPFLSDPNQWEINQPNKVKIYFRKKLFEYIDQPPSQKASAVLAKETVHRLFDNLLSNRLKQDKVWYNQWLDSNRYLNALRKYVKDYKIPSDLDIWNVDFNHCFEAIDRLQLLDVVQNLHNSAFKTKYLRKLQNRARQKSNPLAPSWWKDVVTILTFDVGGITKLHSFDEVVQYYAKEYYHLDRAIRRLYQHFLSEKEILKPLQEYYQSINRQLLDKWWGFKEEYKTNQQGHLVNLLKHTEKKTAVIVGDAIRWEIAMQIVDNLKSGSEMETNIMLADLPSITEHNMSAMYVGNHRVLADKKDREKELVKKVDKPICFEDLEAINATIQDELLVLTYKDVDTAGENLQQGALKLFEEFENVLTDKIQQLLKMGYEEVHLITDHGFVLTGILAEADKLNIPIKGDCAKSERYIRSVKEQNHPELWSFAQSSGKYNYLNVAASDRPFVTRGVYGFAHGGFTPQEIVIPNFKFSKTKNQQPGLKVFIGNKGDLKEVNGENFKVVINSKAEGNSLFENKRTINLVFYDKNIETNRINNITIYKNQFWDGEFSFDGHSEIDLILEDADTQEKLDQVKIKKSSARDFGGLL